MLNFVLQLVWIGFIYYIVSENNKKSEYQGNPILYAILSDSPRELEKLYLS